MNGAGISTKPLSMDGVEIFWRSRSKQGYFNDGGRRLPISIQRYQHPNLTWLMRP